MTYLKRFLVVSLLLGLGNAHAYADNIIILKGGNFSLSKTQQTILSTNTIFDEDSSGVIAFEYEWRGDSGLSFGAEVVSYSNTYTVPTGSGEIDALLLTVNVKQYFRDYSAYFKPYIGAGIGAGTADLSTTTGIAFDGSAGGFAYQLMAGLEFHFHDNLGVYAEYKYISSETEDSAGEKIDISGSGIFAGLSIHF